MSDSSIVESSGVVAVVRLDNLEDCVAIASALVEGGVKAVEYTFTNPTAGEAIQKTVEAIGEDAYVGAGTVLDPETARMAILSGAQYIVTPTTKSETIEVCRRYSVPSIIGAFTATEMLTAWEAGADYVKVHPASLGGPKYFNDILAPLPQLKLIPSGGVTLENAGDFIRAGAVAVALGSALVDAKTVAEKNWETLTERAKLLTEAVQSARSE